MEFGVTFLRGFSGEHTNLQCNYNCAHIVCQSVAALVLSDMVIEQDLVRSIFGFHREVLKGKSSHYIAQHHC